MSWDKNTINMSTIDDIIQVLKDTKTSFKVTTVKEVRGYDLNDTLYKLQKLEYANKILIDQMIRTTDCDTNDVIITRKFKKGKVPKIFKAEITIQNN